MDRMLFITMEVFIINKLADLEGRYVSKQEEGEVRQQDERYQS